jgi:16S rRNA (adenine1518-N6/adenine1519-N6)-dimethyltransferase
MYGQNFLVNPAARAMLLDALDFEPGARVWEIGPGLGAMTAGLLERGAAVTAFEIDKGFIAVLEEFFGGNAAFTLVAGDVLKTWPGMCEPSDRCVPSVRCEPSDYCVPSVRLGDYLLGNLPYNIGAALLADFIEKNRFFKRMVVTVQKEVARRMAARPGSKDYSSFSVLCASAYRVTPLSVLKGASFYPEPRVDSQGVRLDLRTDIDPAAYPVYFRPLLRCLFSSRRKTVKNNLQTFVSSVIKGNGARPDVPGLPAGGISAEVLAAAGIPPNERAERLGLEEFVSLSAALERVLKEEGSPCL